MGATCWSGEGVAGQYMDTEREPLNTSADVIQSPPSLRIVWHESAGGGGSGCRRNTGSTRKGRLKCEKTCRRATEGAVMGV